MDVTKEQWPQMLQPMLTALSNAHFVSFDLELSGISTKTSKSPDTEGSRKQTLEQRYQEMKAAAEKYQILQIGITVVREDTERGVYIARPYNLFLDPVLRERLNIDRTFSFQSSSVDFLLGHGFSIDGPFYNGLPYLSRAEQEEAMKGEKARLDRNNIADIQLGEDEAEALELVRNVRHKVRKWLKLRDRPDFLNIAPDSYVLGGEMQRGFNAFQRRLIHQLVRAENPELISCNQPGFIQIKFLDAKHEESLRNARLHTFKEKIQRQIGFRWFVEGMVGGELKEVDPTTFVRKVNGHSVWYDQKKAEENFEALKQRVDNHRTVLVGHNMFTDLINFYRCFFGPLPNDVYSFQKEIHKLFPLVVDTKYLATHPNNSGDVRSGLAEIDYDLNKITVPAIECHPRHPRYNTKSPIHEAGYDAYTTARVAVRLSAKLEAQGQYIEAQSPSKNGIHNGVVGHGTMQSTQEEDYRIPQRLQAFLEESPRRHKRAPATVQRDFLTPEDELEPSVLAAVKAPKNTRQDTKRQAAAVKETLAETSRRFAPSRASDSLMELVTGGQDPWSTGSGNSGNTDENTVAAQAATNSIAADNSANGGSQVSFSIAERDRSRKANQDARVINGIFVEGGDPGESASAKLAIPTFMPHFENDFWRVYGNKLRVNGTVEEVCDLSEE